MAAAQNGWQQMLLYQMLQNRDRDNELKYMMAGRNMTTGDAALFQLGRLIGSAAQRQQANLADRQRKKDDTLEWYKDTHNGEVPVDENGKPIKTLAKINAAQDPNGGTIGGNYNSAISQGQARLSAMGEHDPSGMYTSMKNGYGEGIFKNDGGADFGAGANEPSGMAKLMQKAGKTPNGEGTVSGTPSITESDAKGDGTGMPGGGGSNVGDKIAGAGKIAGGLADVFGGGGGLENEPEDSPMMQPMPQGSSIGAQKRAESDAALSGQSASFLNSLNPAQTHDFNIGDGLGPGIETSKDRLMDDLAAMRKQYGTLGYGMQGNPGYQAALDDSLASASSLDPRIDDWLRKRLQPARNYQRGVRY